jgi:hypothetical protein
MASDEEVDKARANPLFEQFVLWSNDNGVDAQDGHPDDWFTWWTCFVAGVQALEESVRSHRNS